MDPDPDAAVVDDGPRRLDLSLPHPLHTSHCSSHGLGLHLDLHLVDHAPDARQSPSHCRRPLDAAHPRAPAPTILAHHGAASPLEPANPNDFYKTYRGTLHHPHDASVLVLGSMASPTARPPPRPRAPAANMTPRHAAVPRSPAPSSSPGQLSPPSTTLRTPSGKPSVKDLKKRFDQNGTASSPPSSTCIPRPMVSPGASSPSAAKANLLYSSSRSPVANARQSLSSSARTQRPKFIDTAQVPSSQSFASRIGRPSRNSVNGKTVASKSMTHLSPKVSPLHPSFSPPYASRSHGLVPTHALAHRSEGSISTRHGPASNCRNISHLGPEPSSPTSASWYRRPGARDLPTVSHPKTHLRSQSDAAASLPTLATASSLQTRRSVSASLRPSTSTSRLPVLVRRLHQSSSSSSSSSSVRSASPSVRQRPDATPTKLAKGPRRAPQALTPSNSSTRLQAYIGAPRPKLSPSLKSSRPRQPVSTATTTATRMKAADKSRSRDRSRANGSLAPIDGSMRRRKISVGPIDFEQRREHIRLAYSKSIRQSQELEATRESIADGRSKTEPLTGKNWTDSVASAKAGASRQTAATSKQAAKKAQTAAASPLLVDTLQGPSNAAATLHSIDAATGALEQPSLAPLQVSTAVSANSKRLDLSTLRVPGSFPATGGSDEIDELPQSAVTTTSEATEFDVDPQTNPPLSALWPLDKPATPAKLPDPEASMPVSRLAKTAAQQYSHGGQVAVVDGQPIDQAAGPSATGPGVSDEPKLSGAYEDQLESPPINLRAARSHGTIVTILPPTRQEVRVHEASGPTMQCSHLDVSDESDCNSDVALEPQSKYSDAKQDAQARARDAGHADGPDAFRRPRFHLGDRSSSHRTSTCASSDGAPDDSHYSTQGPKGSAATPSSLAVPQPSERLSQQSAWTDFSVDSTDASDTAKSSLPQSRGVSPSFGHATIFGSHAPARGNVSGNSSSSTQARSDMGGANGSTASLNHSGQPQLPEVDTGDGFFVSYLSPVASSSVSFLPSPDHDPPPIPNSTSASAINSRTSSIFYDQLRYQSTLVASERASDEYMPQAETPLSADAASIDTADRASSGRTAPDSDSKSFGLEGDEPTGQERHRLIQRRNVIKELIDTESVFVRDMNVVEEIYKGTAEACPKLDVKTVKLIFRNSEEIIAFHTSFLQELKQAVSPVYVPKTQSPQSLKEIPGAEEPSPERSEDVSDGRDREICLGAVFQSHVDKMKLAHEGFLRNSDQAAKRLIQIQQDPTVKVWLDECNEVAKDLTAAWDLDSLLIKPMQRITKYPNLIMTLLQHTPHDHPDREPLLAGKDSLETAIIEINKTKKNFELVGQIVGRKRKESDVKAGFARAFGKRVDKLQTSNNRPPEDQEYVKLNEKFGDDYLRLQVVLRDVEFYTRQVSAYVHEFLQYLSSIELVMRIQPGNYPEIETKWVQFNISVRDLEKVALEDHLSQVRKQVIEPFELVIKAYGNPSLAMKKRQKRRLDYERAEQLKRGSKAIDPKLRELVEQYEALNDTLKKELPMLSQMTEKVGNICLGNLVNIQTEWYSIWKEKMKTVLGECNEMPDLKDVVSTFQRDYPHARDQLGSIGILNPGSWGRISQASLDDSAVRTRGRQSDADLRGRGSSVNGESAPYLPAPDFGKRRSGSFTMAPSPSGTGFAGATVPSPHSYYYRDYYAGINTQPKDAACSRSPEMVASSRSLVGTGPASTRPSTGRSFESGGLPRPSSDSATRHRRESSTTYNSSWPAESGRFSNIFHSALPLPDGPEESRRSSRASSRERSRASGGYNVLWLAASLFEFNISTTKHEAGYPYLTYQAGEIFDVIAEKGELWLAKNQDDATDQVGWIWSKHFAKLADS
ncbi:hypothetical protein CDD82_6294 [Ophiocordyceps australis]|uniref:DH domain-containing protein n=1 Tax=Ophiocordyceps australis TaxID=1399860 RepID=A0A2C5YWG1_9HYPO|nr:hypothetical protein CDD82_6294 [Ophiocordyceps australis]